MQGQETKLYIILGLSVAVGAIISYFTYAIKRVAIFILSCGLGIFIALQIYVFLAFYIASLRQLVNYLLSSMC